MGADTKLYVPNKYGIDDVINVIKYHVIPQVFGGENQPVEILQYKEIPSMISINFCGRSMFYHFRASDPLNGFALLSLGCNDQGKRIMKIIAGVLGGLLQEDDGSDKFELFRGRVWEETGLQYFLRYAVIHDNHPGGSSRDDVKALDTAIDNWHENVKSAQARK